MGIQVYDIVGMQEPTQYNKSNDRVLSNEFVSVTVADDGTVTFEDKVTHTKYSGLNRLIYNQDYGDEYNSSPGQAYSMSNIQIGQKTEGPLGSRLMVAGSIAADTGALPIRIFYFLAAHSKRLEIRTTVNNNNIAFRLRASFNMGKSGSTIVDSHFDIVERNNNPGNLAQAQQDFVALYAAGSPSLTVSQRGLPEYQISNGYELTLLRATGKVGDWGTFPSSPSSQEPGVHSFDYAVCFNPGNVPNKDDGSHGLMRAFNVPLVGVYALDHPTILTSNPLFDIDKPILSFIERQTQGEPFVSVRESPSDRSHHSGGGGLPGNVGRHGHTKDMFPTKGQMFDLQPADVLVVSAVKLSERRGSTLPMGMMTDTDHEDKNRSLLIRFYNPYPQAVTARLWVGFQAQSAHIVNLKEERVSTLNIQNGKAKDVQNDSNAPSGSVVEISVAPKKIITVEFVPPARN